jgi:GTP cyclohydrolase IB
MFTQNGSNGCAARREMVPGVLPDVQAREDARRVAIDRVGVKGVTTPVSVRTASGCLQPTVAKVNLYVSLPPERKGTHMSRFLEVLQEHREGLDGGRIGALARRLRERLEAAEAFVEMEFTYFVRKLAPVTQQPGLMDYAARLGCIADERGEAVTIGVSASATSLCPCSKEISRHGAHNQRCLISADVRVTEPMSFEDLAEAVEAAASAEVYSVLKRPDEKFVTEEAFENPKFVEDIIRDLAQAMERDERVTWYRISSENFESIHSHNAYAQIERTKA